MDRTPKQARPVAIAYLEQFWGKVDVAGYTSPFSGHDRVKVGFNQSAVSVSRCKQVGTLLCRFLTRVYVYLAGKNIGRPILIMVIILLQVFLQSRGKKAQYLQSNDIKSEISDSS